MVVERDSDAQAAAGLLPLLQFTVQDRAGVTGNVRSAAHGTARRPIEYDDRALSRVPDTAARQPLPCWLLPDRARGASASVKPRRSLAASR